MTNPAPPTGTPGCNITVATLAVSQKDPPTAQQYADTAARFALITGLVKAQALTEQKRYGEAAVMWQQLLPSAERIFGAEDPRLETFLEPLIAILFESGQGAETEPLLRRAIEIEEHTQAAEYPRLAGNLERLAGLLIIESRYGETE